MGLRLDRPPSRPGPPHGLHRTQLSENKRKKRKSGGEDRKDLRLRCVPETMSLSSMGTAVHRYCSGGASRPHKDRKDQKIIRNTMTNTPKVIGSSSRQRFATPSVTPAESTPTTPQKSIRTLSSSNLTRCFNERLSFMPCLPAWDGNAPHR